MDRYSSCLDGHTFGWTDIQMDSYSKKKKEKQLFGRIDIRIFNRISVGCLIRHIWLDSFRDRRLFGWTNFGVDRHSDVQLDGQTLIQTDFWMDNDSDDQTFEWTDIQTVRYSDSWQTDIRLNRHSDRQIFKRTDTSIEKYYLGLRVQ